MEVTKIDVAPRSERGSAQVARLREAGRVPAILYGGGGDSLSLSVDERELMGRIRNHHRVFRLAMDGKEQAIFLKEVQWDCLTDRPLHADFQRIDLNKPIDIDVELTYLGHPVGAGKGGRLIRDMNALPIACLPASMPETIEIKVSELDLAEKILASEVELPSGVTLRVPDDAVVCHMTGDETALVEEEAPAEGEGAPAEGSGEGDGGGDSPSS